MTNSTPPTAQIKPHPLTIHGHTRTDNYYWLREKSGADTLAYLEAENAYTRVKMSHTETLQEKLYQEMVGRIQETDSTVPKRIGQNDFYTRTEEGKQYTIHCRKAGSRAAAEEILIDENELATGQPYFKLGLFELSPDQSILAYSTDTSGSERYTIYFKNLQTGELLADQIDGVSYGLAWANDNQTIFYTVKNEAWRDYQIKKHRLGSSAQDDQIVFQEEDALFSVSISKSKDKQFLFLKSGGIESSETYFLSADDPDGSFTLFQPRQEKVRYELNHRQGVFYILSNENAPNYQLFSTAATDPARENWQLVLPHSDTDYLQDIELFDEHMVIYGRANGLRTLRIFNFTTDTLLNVDFPEPVYTYGRADNPEPDTEKVRIVYQSLTTADTVYELNMNTLAWEFKKQTPVLGGYDPENYRSERIFATAEDGARIPISLVYKKGMQRNGRAPCLLYGYGSYGANVEPGFDAKRLSLLDRGFIYAIAHVRGSQTMGRHWYDQGKWLHKRNTFTDFIACAEHLICENYTSTEKLVISGRSAGGLLMGAVTTMRPDLFTAVVAGVPFVDVVTTMLDESIPLTVGEFDEWGNPKIKEFYDYMLSYSPYDNTTAQNYPNILITAGLNDPRVQYWEPAKWTAKLRQVKTDDNLLLLKTFMGAGHFSSSGRYDYLKDVAFEYAFVLDVLGVSD